jgi:hypothetical protein
VPFCVSSCASGLMLVTFTATASSTESATAQQQETSQRGVSNGAVQGWQAHRRVEILGPQAPVFGNFERVFDWLIEILAQNEGVFRPVLPETSENPLEMSRSENPIEIGQCPSTSWSKSLGVACEPWSSATRSIVHDAFISQDHLC